MTITFENAAQPPFEAVIGLEVHAQLLTSSKIFSPDSARFGGAPNAYVDAISLAHPGTLPVFNRRVLEFAVRMGLATGCRINRRSIFARKHYFYPDLPKGYQISQYEDPICEGGCVTFDGEVDGVTVTRRIGLTRIHMEEDAGKSIHDQDPFNSVIDLNRCGVPLIEIVSEPDLRSPREAYLYLTRLRQILRYLEICDGNMEEGSFRCDANVSVRPKGATALGTKTELKNMNSFRNVERALEHEIQRQIREIETGRAIVQQTLLWDTVTQVTRPMRSKESAHDYRYFPDPDLVELVLDDGWIQALSASLPELPEARRARLRNRFGLPAYDTEVLTEEKDTADYLEATLNELANLRGSETPEDAKAVSNMIMTDVLRVLNQSGESAARFAVSPTRLAALIKMRLDGAVNSSAATEIFEAMRTREEDPLMIARDLNLIQISDVSALEPVVTSVIESFPKQVEQYLGGKEGLIGFFVGQVMRTFPGSPDPSRVRELLKEKLDALGKG